MRPRRLELHGFAAFRERTVIDFDDLELFALVGSTGAGKSTIIDGIVFALYGSVVRYKSANLVAPVINQLSNEARVRLDFSIGSSDYTATRIVRRTSKGASTKEARLEEELAKENRVLAGNARELDLQVQELLGLDFDQFTKTVVLPQGEFARFLTENAETRQSLLRRLLAMERFRTMGTKARERAKESTAKYEALVEQFGDREPVTEADVANAQLRLTELDALETLVTAAVSERDTAIAEAEHASAELSNAEATLELLRSVKVPAGVSKLTDKVTKLEADRTLALEVAETATIELQAAKEAVDEAEPVNDLERCVELHSEATNLGRELRAAGKVEASAAKALAVATKADDAAGKTLAAARAALDERRIRAGAAGLIDQLTIGEPCPVCDQTVNALPDHDPALDLVTAQQELDTAIADATETSDQLRSAARDHDRAEVEVESLTARQAELTELLGDQPDAKATKAQLQDVRGLVKTLERAEIAGQRAVTKLRTAEERLADVAEHAGALRQALTEQRDSVGNLDPPVPEERSMATDWDAFVTWAKQEATATAASVKELRAAERTTAKAVTAANKEIATLLKPVAQTHSENESDAGPEPDHDPLRWLATIRGRASGELAALKKEHAAQATAVKRIEDLRTQASVASELGRLLSASGFERWLMSEVMYTLAEHATDRLLELSGGAYSLVTDGTDFSIRDHRNADEIRSARTLSGGETFLASLALALALSENVAQLATEGAPRIESMFLDEGFGTLDQDTLDIVASAIEELGAQGRMIGVVTHVRELADRIPTRFNVTRTANGATVDRVQD